MNHPQDESHRADIGAMIIVAIGLPLLCVMLWLAEMTR